MIFLMAMFQAVVHRGWTPIIGVGAAVGILAIVGLLVIAATTKPEVGLNFLLVICGGAIGWALGILLTPSNEQEATKFPEYAKAFSAFISGYVLARLGPAWDKITWDVTFFRRVLLLIGSFSVLLLLLFVVRAYT